MRAVTNHGGQPDLTAERHAYIDKVDGLISTIRTVRIVLMVLIALATVLSLLLTAGLFVLLLPIPVIVALGVYVVFGWFEHTLGLLAGIYMNTRPRETGPQ